jgi:adenosine deaminase
MIDLHLHLDGSLGLEEIQDLVHVSEADLPEYSEEEWKTFLSVSSDCVSLADYLDKFELPLQLLQTEQAITQSVYGLLGRLSRQGLIYAEIRFAPQLHQRKNLTQNQVIRAAVEGLQKGIETYHIPAQLILCCMRGEDNQEENVETVLQAAKFLGQGVCAVDLAGNEAAYPTSQFQEIFELAREKKVPFTIHAGEAAGAESIREALSFGAARIGHGIHAIEDRNVMEQLREQNISLEMCYTSNLQTKAAESPQTYPLKQFRDAGIHVTVNTDNMTVSDTNLRQEYQLLHDLYHFTEDEMQEFALQAADAAWVSETEKERLKDRIQKEFKNWLKNPMD